MMSIPMELLNRGGDIKKDRRAEKKKEDIPTSPEIPEKEGKSKRR